MKGWERILSSLFETDIEDIERLDPLQLTKLLHCLLSNELAANHLPRTDADVSFSINVPDGGADGIVAFSSNSRSRTPHIPASLTIFQAKAGKLAPSKFVNELFTNTSNKTELKPRVNEALTRNGAYVFFYSKECKDKDRYVRQMCEAVRRARPDIASPTINISRVASS
jgi:hypothetical protein